MFSDRAAPVQPMVEAMMQVRDLEAAPIAPQLFGNAGREHMDKYGTKAEHFAKIAHKNHKHSVNNPFSQFRDEYSMEQINGAAMVHEPLTKLHCCPTSDGGAAAVIASEKFVKERGLESRAVEIVGMEMSTDFPAALEGKSCIQAVGFDMTKNAVSKLYKDTGMGAGDVQVVELHDCFSANELITYEALGLCEEGKAGEFIDAGDNTYGGKYVVNPSGGLISKGHPLGATGLAQCYELCSQVMWKKLQTQKRIDCHITRCVARRIRDRWTGRRWRCNTTWAWGEPWSWRFIRWDSPWRRHRRHQPDLNMNMMT